MITAEIFFDDHPTTVIAELNKLLEKNHLLKIVELNETEPRVNGQGPASTEYRIKIIS